MVRSLLLGGVAVGVVCAAAALPAAAVPNNPLVTWQGSVTLLTKTAACDVIPDFDLGTLAYSIYRPQLDAAEPQSALTILLTRGTLIFARTSGNTQMHGTGNYSGIWVSARVTTNTNVIGTYNFVVNPTGIITEATSFVRITGTITNWAGRTGCTVTFRGAYALRPN